MRAAEADHGRRPRSSRLASGAARHDPDALRPGRASKGRDARGPRAKSTKKSCADGAAKGKCTCFPNGITRICSTACRRCGARSPSGSPGAWSRTRRWPRRSTASSTTWSRRPRDADAAGPRPPDRGLAELVGVGPDAAQKFGDVKIPQGVAEYDENVNSERVVAVGDLYYIYQHERIGVFRVVQKLKELFEGGAIRLSGGEGAYRLYQFDRRDVLRYTKQGPAWPRTAGCSATAAASARGRAGRTPTSTCCSRTSSTR